MRAARSPRRRRSGRRARREECGSRWGPQFTGDRTRRAGAKRSGRGGGGVRGAGERAAALLLETRAVGGIEREVTAHAAGDGVREARLLAGVAQAALLGGIGNIGGVDEHRGIGRERGWGRGGGSGG